MSNLLFRRFSIAARIAGAALAFSAFLVIGYLVSTNSYNQLQSSFRRLNELDIPVERLINHAAYTIQEIQLLAEETGEGTPVDLNFLLSELDRARSGLAEANELLTNVGEQPGDLPVILERFDSYREKFIEYKASVDAGDQEKATGLLVSISSLASETHNQLLGVLQTRQAETQARYAASQEAAQNRLVALNAALIGLVLLAVLLALLVSQTISRPLAEIRIAAEGFRFGRRSITLPEEGQDEISQLSKTINHLFSQLNHGYADIEQRVSERTTELAQRAVHVQTAADLAHEVAGGSDVNAALDRAVNLLQNRFGFYFVGIFLLDVERRNLVLKAGTGDVGRSLRARGFRVRIDEASLVSYAASTGEPRVVNDVDTEFIHRKEAALPLTSSEVVLPMKVGGQVIGVLDIQNSNRNSFTTEQVTVLQFISDLLGITVENTRLANSLEQAKSEIQTLYKRYTERTWLEEKASRASKGYQFNMMEVGSIDFELDPALEEQLRSGQPVVVSGDKDLADQNQAGKNTLLAPIMMYNQVIGVIGLEEDQADRTWTQDEKDILQALSSQISLTLENARLLEESQHRSTQLRLLQAVTSAAAAHTDLIELLDHVVQTLRAGLDLPYVGAVVFDPGMTTGLEVTGVSGAPDSVYNSMRSQTWLLRGNSAVDLVLETKETKIIENAQLNALTRALHPTLSRVGTQTLILVPIIFRGNIIGLIDLHVNDPDRTFSEDDRQLLNQVSLQLSSAVEVARSFEEANLRADRERQISGVIQRIRESLDIPTILRTAAKEIRTTLAVPEVTVRLVDSTQPEDSQAPADDPAPQAAQD
jgi:GAF domain-containing protein/HAMP domain-containing protein